MVESSRELCPFVAEVQYLIHVRIIAFWFSFCLSLPLCSFIVAFMHILTFSHVRICSSHFLLSLNTRSTRVLCLTLVYPLLYSSCAFFFFFFFVLFLGLLPLDFWYVYLLWPSCISPLLHAFTSVLSTHSVQQSLTRTSSPTLLHTFTPVLSTHFVRQSLTHTPSPALLYASHTLDPLFSRNTYAVDNVTLPWILFFLSECSAEFQLDNGPRLSNKLNGGVVVPFHYLSVTLLTPSLVLRWLWRGLGGQEQVSAAPSLCRVSPRSITLSYVTTEGSY